MLAGKPVIRIGMRILYTDFFDRHWSVLHHWHYSTDLTGPKIQPRLPHPRQELTKEQVDDEGSRS